jgi:hypothetical protein
VVTSTRARVLVGDDRARMFALIAAQIACMNTYQSRTSRPLPVIALPGAAAGVERAPGERILAGEWARRWSAAI